MSIELQHQKQADAWTADRDAPDRAETLESWFREDTVDHWRHARMYEPVRAFSHDPDARWLTVGDGRFGLDSIRIRRLGFTSVLPTDIGDGLLEQSFRRGLITEYRVENAERMSFADNSFDVVFCKESYHHFPRGPLALYEMLRVARHAVILVEPRDYCIDRPANRSIGPIGFCRGLFTWALQRAGIGRKPLSLKERHQLGDRRDDRPLAQDRAPRREGRPSRSCRSGSPADLVEAPGGLAQERRSGSPPPRVRGEPSHRIPSDPQ